MTETGRETDGGTSKEANRRDDDDDDDDVDDDDDYDDVTLTLRIRLVTRPAMLVTSAVTLTLSAANWSFPTIT